MNLIKNQTFHPYLRDDEAQVVENAVRLAIDSVLNVLCGVNGARNRDYQRTVADRDKEIQRLERRLAEVERELRALRRQGCACALFGPEPEAEQGGFELGLSVGVFARPPSHISSLSHESAPLSSPSRAGLDQSCTSGCSEASEDPAAPPHSTAPPHGAAPPHSTIPHGPALKQEPCDPDTFPLQWEPGEGGGEPPSLMGEPVNCHGQNPQAEPGGAHVLEGELQRARRRSVPMSDLPDEAQRLKRAAWRAASRRYYARKVARQQAPPRPKPRPPKPRPPKPRPFLLLANPQDHRRRAPPPAGPQREAWPGGQAGGL